MKPIVVVEMGWCAQDPMSFCVDLGAEYGRADLEHAIVGVAKHTNRIEAQRQTVVEVEAFEITFQMLKRGINTPICYQVVLPPNTLASLAAVHLWSWFRQSPQMKLLQ